jgi:hypothetical protein
MGDNAGKFMKVGASISVDKGAHDCFVANWGRQERCISALAAILRTALIIES